MNSVWIEKPIPDRNTRNSGTKEEGEASPPHVPLIVLRSQKSQATPLLLNLDLA
jgi:hypothetical protein